MKPLTLERLLVAAALTGSGLVVAMLGLYLATGVGQDPLQFVHPPAEYTQLLLRNPASLRATLALDNAFIVLYSTVFLTLGVLLVREGANRALLLAAMLALGLLGLLDMIENFHFMTMLSAAEQGLGVTLDEIRFQSLESLLKFHVSYAGLFLLGALLPRRTALERALAFASMFVQLPVGILIYTVPPLAYPLVLVRFSFFVGALIALALIYGRRPSQTPARMALAA